MHFCTVSVAIGGDNRNIMERSPFAPVSWPEIEVLRAVHGDEAIGEIVPFVNVNQTPRAERNRLAMIYGDEPLGRIWGGTNAPAEMEAPGVRQKPDIIWNNPLSGLLEKTTPGGSEPYTPPVETRKVTEIVGNYAVRDAEAPAKPESEYYVDEVEEAPPPPPPPVAVQEEAPRQARRR